MKHFQKFLLCFAALLLLLSALPAAAQEELTADELALIEYIGSVYDNFFKLDTVSGTTTQDITQDITADVNGQAITINQVIDQEMLTQIDFDAEGNPLAIYSKNEQSISQSMAGQPAQRVETDSELILIEDQLFMRFATPQPGMPSGWFDPQTLPGNIFNYEVMMEMMGRNSLALYPITPETVLAIEELERDKICLSSETGSQRQVFCPATAREGITEVEVRVIQLEFSSAIIFEQSGLEAMFTSDAGFDVEDMISKMGDNAHYIQTMWIGAEDNMLYRTEFTLKTVMEDIEVTGAGVMDLTQDITGSVEYYGFNEPVKIEAPTIGE